MNRILLMTLFTSFCSFFYSQKFAEIESNGNLRVCDLDENIRRNCNVVEYGGVSIANIGSSKIAIPYDSGELKICSLDENNVKRDCNVIQYSGSGVSNVQMSGDSRVIILYENGSKRACEIDNSYNTLRNCNSL
jgi:hypothetical protein